MLGWDEVLSGNLLSQWRDLVVDLQKAQCISIPRCYFDGIVSAVSYRLLGFCDASKTAYAAVIYLLITTEEVTASLYVARLEWHHSRSRQYHVLSSYLSYC